MAALTVQAAPHSGLNPVAMTTGLGGTSGNTAPCGNGLALLLVNGAAATCNVDILVRSDASVDGLPAATPSGASGPARRVVLPATVGAITVIPLPPSVYADPSTGLATFNVAAGTVSGAVIVQA